MTYWCDSLEEAGLKAEALIRSVRSHAEGIISFVATRLTNDVLEGINSKFSSLREPLVAIGIRPISNV
ncbi:MAG: transposase [Candidatus Kapabacteria bacterium]|nr:transposase [Candidatus Kapabacteria bacterium]